MSGCELYYYGELAEGLTVWKFNEDPEHSIIAVADEEEGGLFIKREEATTETITEAFSSIN
jgi:hypothetical protein